MPAKLESGAIRHIEDQILEAAEEELANQRLEVSATQHSAGNTGLGVESVIIEVSADADDDIQEELMDHAYEEFVGSGENLIWQAVQKSHERLNSYGSENSYAVENIRNSFSGVDVQRSNDTLTIGYGWTHPAAAYMERGTSDHTISGNPVLSFIWEDPPSWVREEFDQGRSSGGQFKSGWRVFLSKVEVSGLPEARFVRAGLEWLESEVGA